MNDQLYGINHEHEVDTFSYLLHASFINFVSLKKENFVFVKSIKKFF
ncbi:hypothetical protein IGK47_001836 [Enterococcus sp. AZ007]